MKNYIQLLLHKLRIKRFFQFLYKLFILLFNKCLKFRTFIFCVLIILTYVCLNNYLIMLNYTTSTEPSLSINYYKSNNDETSNNDDNLDLSHLNNNGTIVYIDTDDLITISLSKNNKRYVLLDHNYFNEQSYDLNTNHTSYFSTKATQHAKTDDRTSGVGDARVCVHPKLNPFDNEIMQYVKPEKNLSCNPRENWVYIENGTLRLSPRALKKHGNIICAYIPLFRGDDDFTVREGNRIFPVFDQMPLITDFFKVDCRSKDNAIYSNIHSGIAYDSTLKMRPIWYPLPKKALGYNVLMLGFDSVSRMSWIRMLPKTYEYIVKQLGIVILKGYNIVGDGTPQALLPILTGKKETELPEARRGFVNARYVDVFPWIWNDYKSSGYVTQWAEDMQSIGTFQMRMLGFRNQPVDHYMRVFYLEAEKYYTRFRRFCLGSVSRHQNLFNWVKEFFNMYENQPKFSFIFHSETSHNYNNPLSLVDEDLLSLLKHFKEHGHFDNTILFLMSDHGVRVNDLRQYSQGKLEERLPFFSILMPRTFQVKYPNEMRNLRLNSHKLTTPFDIHETLLHFLNFESNSKSNSNDDNTKMTRGISLLKHIPANRSCEDADIEAHWCACLSWINVNITSNQRINNSYYKTVIDKQLNELKSTYSLKSIHKQYLEYYNKMRNVFQQYSKSALIIALKAVDYMNSLIGNDYSKYCELIRLKSIEKLSKLDLNKKLLSFKNSKDMHGREALFDDEEQFSEEISDLTTSPVPFGNISVLNNSTQNNSVLHTIQNTDIVFQIVLTTFPGDANYEVSVKYNKFKNTFKVSKNEISRINTYNGTSNCMLNKRPDLRQFCYCKYF